MTLFENFLSRHIAFPAVVLVLVLAAACGGPSGDAVDAGCSGLEVLPNRAGLVNRSEAEELATALLAMPAPEISGTEFTRYNLARIPHTPHYEIMPQLYPSLYLSKIAGHGTS